MSSKTMHDNEVFVDEHLVLSLMATQFPEWAHLPISRVASAGTDNAMYRLGTGLAVRLPRYPAANQSLVKEQRWLPQLAPKLPLAVPAAVAEGQPSAEFPFHWSVCPWLEGQTISPTSTALSQVAKDLADFLKVLHRLDVTGGPAPGQHNFYRGVPLAQRDENTCIAIESLRGMIDTEAALAAWQLALAAPVWHQAPVWIHGDLQPGNLLLKEGRLSAVIDFGGLGIGDPACDLLVAWTLFSSGARQIYRQALAVDDATWQRGRGWALSFAVTALPYYHKSNPVLADIARYTIRQVFADMA